MKALIALATLIAAAAAAQPRVDKAELDRLRTELNEVETLIERFRGLTPASFDLEEQKRRIAAAGHKAKVDSVNVRLVATRQNDPLEIHDLEVSGTGTYASARSLIYMLRLTTPLDSVRFDARDGGDVVFVARFSHLVWKGDDALPPTGDQAADLRRMLDHRRTALSVAVAATDRTMIHESENALAEFANALNETRTALTVATVANVLTIEGVTVGSAARAAVEDAVVKAKLQPASITWSEKGRCSAFAIKTAPPPPAEPLPDTSFVHVAGIFDAASAKFCETDGALPRKIVAKRGGSRDRALFLSMRRADIGHAFFILNQLFNEHFILDPDIRGRIDLDAYDGATIDDLYAAFGAAGIRVGSGPLRRVSTGKASPVASTAGGEPITVSFHDASLSQVLCLMKKVAGRDITMSASQQRKVRIYATDLPAGLLADALTPPPAAPATDPCLIDSPARPRVARNTELAAPEWPIGDLRLVAVGMFPGSPKAFFEVPTGVIIAMESGGEVRDGHLKKITAAGVTFDRIGEEVILGLQ